MAGGCGGADTSGYLLTFGPINKTMAEGFVLGGAVVVVESALPICQQTSVNYLCKLGPKE